MIFSEFSFEIENFFLAKLIKNKKKLYTLIKKNRIFSKQKNLLNEFIKEVQNELSSLQKEGSYIGDVVRYSSHDNILVRINADGKFIVHASSSVNENLLKTGCRVALKSDSYLIYKILPQKIDPLISLMRIENIPNSTYRSRFSN